MVKWDYLVLHTSVGITQDNIVFVIKDGDETKIKTLIDLGEEGWNLITILDFPPYEETNKSYKDCKFFFKKSV